MRIEDLMCRDVYRCGPDDSLETAARLMWEHDCGCVPVCSGDGERVIGMITDRDISMCALFEGKPLAALRVQDAMSRDVSCCGPADESKAVEGLMSQRQIRRVPVVSAEGRLVGIVSLADLAGEARPGARGSDRVTEAEISRTLASICARPTREATVPTLATALQERPRTAGDQPRA